MSASRRKCAGEGQGGCDHAEDSRFAVSAAPIAQAALGQVGLSLSHGENEVSTRQRIGVVWEFCGEHLWRLQDD
jgi:hypothetical protein